MMMEEEIISQEAFKKLLLQWNSVGRSLLNLPKVSRGKDGLTISIINIENTTINTLDQQFKSYKAYLSWYGEILDKIEYW
jgi:hypothetical protein